MGVNSGVEGEAGDGTSIVEVAKFLGAPGRLLPSGGMKGKLEEVSPWVSCVFEYLL